jgi:hypothetical protein
MGAELETFESKFSSGPLSIPKSTLGGIASKMTVEGHYDGA